MKVKTSNLKGAGLDYAVCIAIGLKPEDIYIQKWGSMPASLYRRNRDEDGELDGSYTTGPDLLFSRKWEAGGPILQNHISELIDCADDGWEACCNGTYGATGSTALEAVCKAFVASKLGNTVEIPNDLI